MNIDLDTLFPDGISDEAAAVVSDLLWQLISAWETRFFIPLCRYHDSRRPPCDPHQPWKTLLPDR